MKSLSVVTTTTMYALARWIQITAQLKWWYRIPGDPDRLQWHVNRRIAQSFQGLWETNDAGSNLREPSIIQCSEAVLPHKHCGKHHLCHPFHLHPGDGKPGIEKTLCVLRRSCASARAPNVTRAVSLPLLPLLFLLHQFLLCGLAIFRFARTSYLWFPIILCPSSGRKVKTTYSPI